MKKSANNTLQYVCKVTIMFCCCHVNKHEMWVVLRYKKTEIKFFFLEQVMMRTLHEDKEEQVRF